MGIFKNWEESFNDLFLGNQVDWVFAILFGQFCSHLIGCLKKERVPSKNWDISTTSCWTAHSLMMQLDYSICFAVSSIVQQIWSAVSLRSIWPARVAIGNSPGIAFSFFVLFSNQAALLSPLSSLSNWARLKLLQPWGWGSAIHGVRGQQEQRCALNMSACCITRYYCRIRVLSWGKMNIVIKETRAVGSEFDLILFSSWHLSLSVLTLFD